MLVRGNGVAGESGDADQRVELGDDAVHSIRLDAGIDVSARGESDSLTVEEDLHRNGSDDYDVMHC